MSRARSSYGYETALGMYLSDWDFVTCSPNVNDLWDVHT